MFERIKYIYNTIFLKNDTKIILDRLDHFWNKNTDPFLPLRIKHKIRNSIILSQGLISKALKISNDRHNDILFNFMIAIIRIEISSGSYHFYRGALGPEGLALLSQFYAALDMLKLLRYINRDQYINTIKNIRCIINGLG